MKEKLNSFALSIFKCIQLENAFKMAWSSDLKESQNSTIYQSTLIFFKTIPQKAPCLKRFQIQFINCINLEKEKPILIYGSLNLKQTKFKTNKSKYPLKSVEKNY